jgi:hypothetical protein
VRAYAGCHAVLGVRADLIELLLRSGLSVAELSAIAGVGERTLQGDLCLRAMLNGGIEASSDLSVRKLREWERFVHAIAVDPRYRIRLGKTEGRRVRDAARPRVSLKHIQKLEEDEERVSLLRHCLEAATRRKVEGVRFSDKRASLSAADVIGAYLVSESLRFRIPALTDSKSERMVHDLLYQPSPQDVRAALGVYFRSARRRLSSKTPFDLEKFRRRWVSEPRRNGALTKLPRLPSSASAFDHKAYDMQARWIENQRSRLRSLLGCYEKVRNALVRLSLDVEVRSRRRSELSDAESLIMRGFFQRGLGEGFE